MTLILTCNAGSTNTKLAAFDATTLERKGQCTLHRTTEVLAWLCSISSHNTIIAIVHRVVHGGQDFTQPTYITDDVLRILKSYIPLAPLHEPIAVALIQETKKIYPDIPHIACFDTAFHHTMPDIHRRFALPQSFYDDGIIRYGFHGLSYQHISEVMPDHQRVIIAHLGGGASACALQDRKSVASTMGFSTLDGLMMGTRCGTIDAGVLLYLLQEKNMTPKALSDLLYHHSGLRGVSGISDNMQELLASKNPAAHHAVNLFCMMAAKEIAGLIPALGGVDALIFTGGIGENAPQIRDKIGALLHWLGDISISVIPTDEELVMAQASQKLRNTMQKKATARWENEGGATQT
jgi:acetate kinase